ncbi:cysteine synthase A [Tremella mesenterica]|uniref:cysteine synthase n=1 Tax=Tremella mesenterica TaxID=5217 RepID=A0A4Q1BTC3_TREME|nr:cysteine synthase A [Tremella mesenterica]
MGILDLLPPTFWDRIRPPTRISRDLIFGLLFGITFSLSSTSLALLTQSWRRRRAIARIPPRPIELRSDEIVAGVIGLIGNTPLVRIGSLSDALGVEILGKAEFLNPGGSVKDRVALRIIEDAESQGLLHPHTGSVLFEGTVGSTGISLATVGRAKGYDTVIVMPDDVAIDKVQILEKLGAKVERVRPASIVDEKQNLARRRAEQFGQTTLVTPPQRGDDIVVTTQATTSEVSHTPLPLSSSSSSSPSSSSSSSRSLHILPDVLEKKPRGFFADQFENDSNWRAHYDGTGPEILRQTGGHVDAFVSGAGTGGTITGVGKYLKNHLNGVQIILADPQGSGLFNKVRYNVMYDHKESEGTKRRHQVDTIVEGIGINRITHNLQLGLKVIDDAYRISDLEALAMSRWLVKYDGMFLGSSSACNLVACVKVAKKLGRGKRVVTILCDSGSRHQNKFWSEEYLRENNLEVDISLIEKLIAS